MRTIHLRFDYERSFETTTCIIRNYNNMLHINYVTTSQSRLNILLQVTASAFAPFEKNVRGALDENWKMDV